MNIQLHILHSLNHFSLLSFFIILFGASVLSLSSCTIARIPIVLGFMGGISKNKRQSVVILSGFTLGLILSYTALGVIFGLFSQLVNKFATASVVFYYLAGGTLFLFGLYLLGFLPRIGKQELHCSYTPSSSKNYSFFGALFFGISFAFFEAPVCPCCGPVLLLLASATFTQAKFLFGLLVFFIYALGQSLPIFIIGLSADMFKFSLEKVHRIEPYIQAIAGVVLVCFGAYLLWLA